MQTYAETTSKARVGTKVYVATWVFLVMVLLRVSGLVTSVAATWITFTCKETALVYGVPMDAKYSYSSAFKFYAIVTAITSGVSLVSLIVIIILRWKGLLKRKVLIFFFFLDLIMMLLLLAGCAAATAVGVVGKYGNDHAGWVPICDNFTAFCHKVTIGIVFGYLGVICFFTLTIIYVINSSIQVNVVETYD